jgi:hypothetical protein
MEYENYANCTRPTLNRSVSFLARYWISAQMQDKTKKRLKKYGKVKIDEGKYESEVYPVAREAFKALSVLLGDKPFFLGDR